MSSKKIKDLQEAKTIASQIIATNPEKYAFAGKLLFTILDVLEDFDNRLGLLEVDLRKRTPKK